MQAKAVAGADSLAGLRIKATLMGSNLARHSLR